MKEIILSNKKIAEVYINEGDFNLVSNREKFSESLVNEEISSIKKSIGFADNEELKIFLRDFVIGKNNKYKISEPNFNHTEILNVIKNALQKCLFVFNDECIKILIFPTIDDFAIEKMKGTTGYCVFNKTIFVGLHISVGWEQNLQNTVIHETAHALSLHYNMADMSIKEGIIFEGLAEHFREKFSDSKRSDIVKGITKKQAIDFFHELKPKLDIKDYSSYAEVFFGSGKYPNWTGYSIGYYLIEDYLKTKKEIDWKRLLRKNPHDIFKEIRNY